MDEEDDDAVFEEKSYASKLSRKVGEKLRRDRLNSLITQLAEEIPIIKYAHRRLDKSAILRLTVSYMKLHLGLKRKKLGSRANTNGAGLLNWLKKVTDDVLLIISQSGTIIYVSPKIFDMLGFYQTDMVGHDIKRFVHPDDLDVLMSQFSVYTDVSFRSAFTKYPLDPNSSLSIDCQMFGRECKTFCIRMLKVMRRKQLVDETKEYEMICIRANCENSLDVENTRNSVDELWMLAMLTPFSSDPIKEVDVKISEFMRNNEWASMHDLDSKIIANEQRSSLFHGFLVSEILGKTPYMLICEDDLESVAISHQMIMKNHHIPSTVFRMNNKFDMTIFIQAESIIVKDNWTKNPKCIVSVNRVLSSEEGRYLLDSQKQRTKEFMDLQEDMENFVQVKEEVESDDSLDSCRGYSQEQSESSRELLQQIKETPGKNLKEIYDKESQNFPKLYVSGESCSNARNFFDSEKRSFECVDSDHSCLDSENSTNTLSDTSSVSATEEVYTPKFKSPSLKDLLSDEKCFKQSSIYSKTSDNSSDQDPLPILKGILQGNVKNNESDCSPVKSEDSDENFSKTLRQIHVREFISSAVSAKENEVASVSSLRLTNKMTNCHAGGRHSAGIQSPTVDSSEVASVASSKEGTIETSSVKSSVYCRFTSQLVKKHSLLRQTIDNQRLTLEILRDQLQKSHNNVVLSFQQKKVHDSLIEKITEAEDQVTVQCELLTDLEQEILEQQN